MDPPAAVEHLREAACGVRDGSGRRFPETWIGLLDEGADICRPRGQPLSERVVEGGGKAVVEQIAAAGQDRRDRNREREREADANWQPVHPPFSRSR